MPHWVLPVLALRVLAGCVLLTGIGAAGQARGQADAAATSTRPLLRVFTGYAAPFVMLPGTPVSGFSIEVWQEVARRLGVDTAWTVLPDLSDEAQIDAVAERRADLALSALAITAAREARVDFSLPYCGFRAAGAGGRRQCPTRSPPCCRPCCRRRSATWLASAPPSCWRWRISSGWWSAGTTPPSGDLTHGDRRGAVGRGADRRHRRAWRPPHAARA